MADRLVTGDNDLLTLGEHHGVRIVTPRQFLDEL
jgi:predicted nucleic acid-binding protein